jgi:hypothetical protein
MEPTPRLFLCLLCHEQVILCSRCDHGQIYCGKDCAYFSRQKSLRLARLRYQKTFNGRRKHAACQARYRRKLKNKVTDHGSPHPPQDAPIESLENRTERPEKEHEKPALCCCFCKKQVSAWMRRNFLKRRDYKKPTRLQNCPQAP